MKSPDVSVSSAVPLLAVIPILATACIRDPSCGGIEQATSQKMVNFLSIGASAQVKPGLCHILFSICWWICWRWRVPISPVPSHAVGNYAI